MVPAAQGPELVTPVLGERGGTGAVVRRELLQTVDGGRRGSPDLPVVLARAETARSICSRSSAGGRPTPRSCRSVNCVRTATMPHPMSTPTAAGITAPTVGITEPTVAPMPWCASGMSATCGSTNGMLAVRLACSSVSSSTSDAQE
ncbi:hypothetical protein GCM10022262_20000 [Georgenia daeguensis]|uniref:Uncharacterized protein n=1 Tax=Georgenia daeguensis TaxID=908355 RepID=A0ABP8EUV1_9MICO